jgi:multidrug efflux system membrane fusion protein
MRSLAPVWLLVLLLALTGCSDRAGGNTPPKAPPAVPVTVGEAVQKVVPLQVMAVGTVQAYTSVGIKSQIAGQILTVHFKEGDEVRRGDLLFTIDPRPFEAAVRQAEATVAKDNANLKQAQATLERDQAQLENSRVQERRYRELLDRDLIAREQYDQLKTNWAAMEATVEADRAAVENTRAAIRADQAALDNARVNLGYTTIRAPIDGRAGSVLVQAGNVVKGNDDNPIVVINQVHPIYLSFAVPEQHLENIKKYRAQGPLKVEARLPNRPEPLATGELTFVNNTVDPGTGTIQLKATFANRGDALWPGQFLDAVLTLTSQSAIVVPSQAIQPGQKGPYVFVVKADQTVESRAVQPGARLGPETIVMSGLGPGEQVVTDGQLRLVPGAKVEVKPPVAAPPASPAPASPATGKRP